MNLKPETDAALLSIGQRGRATSRISVRILLLGGAWVSGALLLPEPVCPVESMNLEAKSPQRKHKHLVRRPRSGEDRNAQADAEPESSVLPEGAGDKWYFVDEQGQEYELEVPSGGGVDADAGQAEGASSGVQGAPPSHPVVGVAPASLPKPALAPAQDIPVTGTGITPPLAPEPPATAPGVSDEMPALPNAGTQTLQRVGATTEGADVGSNVSAPGFDDSAVADCQGCPEMVRVEPQSFMMGSNDGEAGHNANESPQHLARFNAPFAIGRYEVSRKQYARFVAETHRADSECQVWEDKQYVSQPGRTWRDPGFRQSEFDPVVCVTWQDAKMYVDWLAKKTGQPYRLASEAEWEYAARAGTGTSRFWGDDPDAACGYANVADQAAKTVFPAWQVHGCSDGIIHTAPVGHYQPNKFNLHDMLGNVWEWVEDCYVPSYDGAPGSGNAARGSGDCSYRVVRGGSGQSAPAMVRSAARGRMEAIRGDANTGFRVVKGSSKNVGD